LRREATNENAKRGKKEATKSEGRRRMGRVPKKEFNCILGAGRISNGGAGGYW